MITITRKGLQLAINDEIIPAQGSSDVPIRFINDNETYQNYLIEPRVGWFKDGYPKSTVAKYEKGIIYLPAEVFIKNGPIAIVIALIDPQNSNHIEVTQSVISAIANAPLGDIILPEKETWEQAVTSLVKQLNEQIQADVAEAIKKANKASEDATEALNISNQTNQTINEKIEDGSFIPQATAGTVEMTQPGTKAEVTITGDKKNPEFNFRIPKDEIDDSEDIKKALLQGTYTTDLAEEYKGVVSDYGAEILKIEGKSEQITTTGANILNTDIYNEFIEFSATKGTYLTLMTNGVPSNGGNIKFVCTDDSEEWFAIDEGENRVYRAIQKDVKGFYNLLAPKDGLKYMLAVGDIKTYEPFTGGEPSPNPNYPQEIRNALDEPLVSVGRNLFDASKIKTKSQGGATVTNNGDGSFTISGSGNLTEAFFSGYTLSHEETVKLLKVGKLTLKGAMNMFPYFQVKITSTEGNIYLHSTNTTVQITQAHLDDKTMAVSMLFYGDVGKKITNEIIKPMLYQEGNGEWEPYKRAETSLNLSDPLCSLPDGTCDTYDNGVITRRIEFKEFDGSDDEAWKLQSINSNGIANFNIPISSSNQVADSMCNRFIFDKNSIAQVTKEGYHLNDNNFFIRLKKETASTVEQLKEWLKEHPVRLLYKLPNPTTEKVELPIIPTFYPYTNIFQSDDVKARIQYGLRSKVDECPYGVGDLYITMSETLPSVKWKGTSWERVEGFVPVGYKASDADFGTLGKTGGAKTVTLTEEQIPEHGHQAEAKKAGNHKHGIALKTAAGSATPHTGAGIKEGSWSSTDTHAWLDKGLCEELGEHDHVITVENAGGSQAHNNLQPYKVFNMWLRTK